MPTIEKDLAALWETDPEAVPKVILDNETMQGGVYRRCAAYHEALIEWVRSLE